MPSAEDELELPDIKDFNNDERLFAQFAVGVARAGGALFLGRLLECRVGRLLNAQFPRYGISPWDLRLKGGLQVEVKTGVKSFSLANKGSKEAHVWVFVHKDTSQSKPPSYSVASTKEVRSIATKSISAKDLVDRFGLCEESELAGAVANAAVQPTQLARVDELDDESSDSASLLNLLSEDVRSLVEKGKAEWERIGGSIRFADKRFFFEAEVQQFLRKFVRCDPKEKRISVVRKVDLEKWSVDPTLHEEYLEALNSATPAVCEHCQSGKLWISFDEISLSDVSLLFSAAKNLLQQIRRLE